MYFFPVSFIITYFILIWTERSLRETRKSESIDLYNIGMVPLSSFGTI